MSGTAATSTAAVAQELVSLCRVGRNMDAIAQLYSPDIISVESATAPEMPAEMRGMDAVRGKNEWWLANHDVHSHDVKGPFVSDGDQFAVHFDYDVTFKPTGERMRMSEMALYTVTGGKIAHEHFFYKSPSA